jgi:transposase
VTCIQKEGETRIIIDHLPPIIRIPDKLWDEIKKVIPKEKSPSHTVGRPMVKHRKVLDGILYVLRTEGCQWKMLPKEYTVQVQHAIDAFRNGIILIFSKIHGLLFKIYDKEMGINWTWQSPDSISIKSPLGGDDCRK